MRSHGEMCGSPAVGTAVVGVERELLAVGHDGGAVRELVKARDVVGIEGRRRPVLMYVDRNALPLILPM